MKKNILTIATGKKIYADLALNLFHSFLRWHENTEISFYLITDRINLIPANYHPKLRLLSFPEKSIGEGFYPKILLDQLAPEGRSLFIDSDCLIFENLEWVFEQFEGKKLSVIGGYISDGEWFGDITTICKNLKIEKMPKFNGGLYYLDKCEELVKIFETAREIEKNYDRIGFERFRGHAADEPIMAVAMALHNQHPVADSGLIMSDLQACPGKYSINVIKGSRSLTNPAQPHANHRSWYPFSNVQPAVVHFLGFYTDHYPYRREAYRLKKFLNGELNLVTEFVAKVVYQWPEILKIFFKDIFRPIYRILFGKRKIIPSNRI